MIDSKTISLSQTVYSSWAGNQIAQLVPLLQGLSEAAVKGQPGLWSSQGSRGKESIDYVNQSLGFSPMQKVGEYLKSKVS